MQREIKKDIFSWFDSDGLMSNKENPGKCEEGNPILETGVAYLILKQNNALEPLDKAGWDFAMSKLKNEKYGFWDKKIGTNDQLTHDDVVGLFTGSLVFPSTQHIDFVREAEENHWVASNTFYPFPEAYIRPWDKVWYKAQTLRHIAWDEWVMFNAHIIINAFSHSTSEHRLMYLRSVNLSNAPIVTRWSILFWKRKMREKYGSPQGLMKAYYKKEDHPHVRWALKEF